MENAELAAKLDHLALLLEAQHASRFKVNAWKAAADAARRCATPIARVGRERGPEGIRSALECGTGIASAVRELTATGHLHLLERLEEQTPPERLFLRVPGMGPTLAKAIVDRLGIESLEELEQAAHDGRLRKVPGFGRRRVELVKDALCALLRHPLGETPGQQPRRGPFGPSVETLLRIDAGYRAKDARNALPKIAPTRFNPGQVKWLSVMHGRAEGFAYTAMYSNTERAHRLGRTRDWVVIYFERDGREGQATVVTEVRGPRAGRRVVRGREKETRVEAQESLALH